MQHTVRTKDGGTKTVGVYTRGLAIKLHCTECLGNESDPKKCTSPMCALYPYRARTYLAYKSDISATPKTGLRLP